jgi:hypothetical protein
MGDLLTDIERTLKTLRSVQLPARSIPSIETGLRRKMKDNVIDSENDSVHTPNSQVGCYL